MNPTDWIVAVAAAVNAVSVVILVRITSRYAASTQKILDQLPQEPEVIAENIQSEPEPIGAEKESRISLTIQCNGKWRNRGREKVMVVYGSVSYRDIFDKTRNAFFGYEVNSHGRFDRLAGYPEYNKNA